MPTERVHTAQSRVAYANAEAAAVALEETIEYLPHDFAQTRSQTSMCVVCLETEWTGNHLDEPPEETPVSIAVNEDIVITAVEDSGPTEAIPFDDALLTANVSPPPEVTPEIEAAVAELREAMDDEAVKESTDD